MMASGADMVDGLKLSAAQKRGIEEIRARLRALDESGTVVLEWVTAELRKLLRVDAFGAYAVEDAVTGPRMGFGVWAGLPIPSLRVNQHLSCSLERLGPFGGYDALRPSREQRNQVIVFPSTREIEQATEINVRALKKEERYRVIARVRQHHQTFVKIGVHDLQHQRMLICDGPRLLAWFGALASDTCTPQRRRLLQLCGSLVRPRLRLERERKFAGVAYAALDASLEAIGAPALVLSAEGAIVHANAVGHQLLDRDRQRITALLSRVQSGATEGVDIYDLASRDQPGASLVVLRSRGMLAAARQRAAVAAWRLTPREGQVLQLLIAGDTNRDIATTLGCAEATVEIHASRLLNKARVATRTALVSAYWNL